MHPDSRSSLEDMPNIQREALDRDEMMYCNCLFFYWIVPSVCISTTIIPFCTSTLQECFSAGQKSQAIDDHTQSHPGGVLFARFKARNFMNDVANCMLSPCTDLLMQGLCACWPMLLRSLLFLHGRSNIRRIGMVIGSLGAQSERDRDRLQDIARTLETIYGCFCSSLLWSLWMH